MWLDAAAITNVIPGQSFTTWPDISGTGATAVQGDANSTYYPIYTTSNGYPEVQNVAGGGFNLTFPTALAAGEVTCFFVGRTSSLASSQYLLNMNVLQWGAKIINSTFTPLGVVPWDNGFPAPSGSTNGVMAFAASRSAGFSGVGTGSYVINNGLQCFRVQDNAINPWPNTAGITSGFLMGNFSQAPNSFQGSLRAFLLFDRALSLAEMRRVIQYLSTRYAVAGSNAPTRQFIFDGDSLTNGAISSPVDSMAYPDQIALAGTYKTSNLGTSAQTITLMIADAATQVDPLRDTTMVKDVVIAWGGTNDMTNVPSNPTAAFNSLKSYCQARKTAGFKVIVLTCLPRGAVAQFETDRISFNSQIRADTSFYDAIADVGANATIGVAGSQTNATYYNADQLHLTSAGYLIVAGLVQTAIGTL